MNPAAGNFNVTAKMLMDDGRTDTFTHQQIATGAAQILLSRPRICTVNLTVSFTGNATVTLGARVVKPGGGIHGNPFSEAITGQNAGIEEAAVLAVTRK